MARDLGTRFTTDPKRLYATGHSGGARVALQLALRNPIAGVIASSAGFPDRLPHSKLSFVLFGTAGDTDFNYIEMKMLDNSVKSPHRVVIFDGGHTLPPDDLAMEAIEWLELQAFDPEFDRRTTRYCPRFGPSASLLATAAAERPPCEPSHCFGISSKTSRACATQRRRRISSRRSSRTRRRNAHSTVNATRTDPNCNCSRRSAVSRPG
jgi:pimeloyl-ACP methyl ester carboxylesterase